MHVQGARKMSLEDAILAPDGKTGGWWHHCEFRDSDDHAHCNIWNANGLALYEGVFLPLDHAALNRDELKVVYNSRWGDNTQFICLHNGRVLVPASDFKRLSEFGEWLQGKRSAPH